MVLSDVQMAQVLELAGLRFRERVRGAVRSPVLPPGYSPASADTEHGRFDSHPEEIADIRAPDMAEKINASWGRMAVDYGLLDDNREFLLVVEYREPGDDEAANEEQAVGRRAWVRVQLLDRWDFVASEPAPLRSEFAATMTTRFVPEFTAVSLDGRTLLNTTVWGDGTVSTIAIRPELASPKTSSRG